MEKEKMPKLLRAFLFLIIGTVPAIVFMAIVRHVNSPRLTYIYDLLMFIILPIVALVLWVLATYLESRAEKKQK